MDRDLTRSRAILIGNGTYQDPRIPDLPAAECVIAMTDLLTGELCGWPAERVTSLVDVASPDDLARKVIEAIRDTQDVLLVYYVGHGVRTSEGQLALTVGNTDPDWEALPHTAILYENLAKILRRCRAATKLVLLDCCHAELANKANHLFQSVDFGETYPIDGVYVIGASSRDKKAKTPLSGTLTCFTEAFLNVVRTGIPESPDPALRMEQIFLELHARLRNDGLPEPVDSGARGARRFPFALNAAHLDHHVELPEDTPEAPPGRLPRVDRRTLLTAVGAVGLTVGTTILTLKGHTTDTATASHPSRTPPSSQAPNTVSPVAMTSLGQPLLGHTDAVHSVAFQPGGRVLASGSADQTVRFWDLTDPPQPKPIGGPFSGHTDTVYSVVFSPDGNLLADGSADQKVRLLKVTDPAKPVPLGRPATGHTDAVFSVAFSPSGELLAGGSGDRTIRLWRVTDPAHPELVGEPVIGHTDAVLSMAFSHDESVMGSGGSDHAVRLWNVADPPAPIGPALPGHTDRVYCVTFSPNGHLLASGSGDRTIRLWKVADPANPVPLANLTGHTAAVNTVAFHPDGRVLASGSSDKTIRLWRVTESANPVPLGRPFTGHGGAVYSVAFSPDGNLLASGSADQTIRLWRLAR
ncbi:caspase family protein [Streptomyces sp. BPTC-684]|uniref:caspase, EACC1-associated type n=1 Tax=Streptomyces sp. BPTC-684 TaxID=3043734 RepID=UPI0024B2559F|nr:caspase family protein [Streptomyces sp. BPTC-684]WHM40733.1 caspase family protein [Streptomyces sp. BPTC-684]